jgi:hypothetical protein
LFDFVDFLKSFEKELTFIFLIQSILWIIGEREITRNLNINIRNKLKVALKFFGNYKFL